MQNPNKIKGKCEVCCALKASEGADPNAALSKPQEHSTKGLTAYLISEAGIDSVD